MTNLKKGDKRISSSSRVCSVCGKRLTGFSRVDGKTYTKQTHYHLFFSELLQSDICDTLKSCCDYLDIRKE